MRIIAGKFRSRPLQAPTGASTRPTSDRLRETLFNVLAPRIGGSAFLDLYAGSGAVGIEALSRGAVRVEFVERNAAALRVLRANLARLEIGEGVCIHAASVESWLRGAVETRVERLGEEAPRRFAGVFDLVFLDPPWDTSREYGLVLGLLGGAAAGILASGGLIIAEHRRKQPLEARYGGLERTRLLEQGDAALSFYSPSTAGPA